jgi:cytoskeletal protein RodZ
MRHRRTQRLLEEVFLMRFVSLFLTLTLLFTAACARHENQGGGANNDTIAPAAAQPDTTGTEMTQTVDVTDQDRSGAEGGTPNPNLTTNTTGVATGTTTGTTTAPATTTTATRTAPTP